MSQSCKTTWPTQSPAITCTSFCRFLREMHQLVKGSKRRRISHLPANYSGDLVVDERGVWQGFQDQHVTSMLWAAACMCFFFGLLRVGEVVLLLWPTLGKVSLLEVDMYILWRSARTTGYAPMHREGTIFTENCVSVRSNFQPDESQEGGIAKAMYWTYSDTGTHHGRCISHIEYWCTVAMSKILHIQWPDILKFAL